MWTNPGITIYITYISVDLAHYEIVRAEVGKGEKKGSVVFCVKVLR